MGGEPTFVSIDDFDGAEWNTIALGPMKRGLADTLRATQRQFAPGAFSIMARASGIPANRCRAGLAATGGAMASPLGKLRADRDAAKNSVTGPAQSAVFMPRSRSTSALTRSGFSPAMRILGIISGRNAACPRTSTRMSLA